MKTHEAEVGLTGLGLMPRESPDFSPGRRSSWLLTGMFILNVNCYADQAFGLLNKQGDLIFNKLAQEPESARERIYQWEYVIQRCLIRCRSSGVGLA